jgi:hypothetical protein
MNGKIESGYLTMYGCYLARPVQRYRFIHTRIPKNEMPPVTAIAANRISTIKIIPRRVWAEFLYSFLLPSLKLGSLLLAE